MGTLDFLNQFKSEKAKVGIYVSSKSILEVVQFDCDAKKVLKYSYSDLNYNASTKSIDDLNDFEFKIQHLFRELDIKQNSEIILSLPTILMDHKIFPAVLDTDSLRMAFTAEAEENYIFKKNEPVVSWEEVETKNIDLTAETKLLCYSAIPRTEVERIEAIFAKLGFNLVAIDNSYAALMRGIYLTGLVDIELESNLNWNILLITSNSYVVFSLKGNQLMELFENPFAVKSLSPDEVYPTISSSVLASLSNYLPQHLVIVSESEEVSAEVLINHLGMTCNVSSIECNKFKNYDEDLYPCELTVLPNKKIQLSPEVVGSACWNQTPMALNFNLSSSDRPSEAFGKEIEIFGNVLQLTPKLFEHLLIGGIGVLIVFMAANYFIISAMTTAQQKIYQDLALKQNQVEQQLSNTTDVNTGLGLQMSEIMKKVYSVNKDLLKSYDSIAIDIPEKLWIDTLEIRNDLNVYMLGKSYNIEDIIDYFQSLNKLSKFKNLKITSLKVTDFNMSQNNIPNINMSSSSLDKLPPINSYSFQKCYEFEFGDSSLASQGVGKVQN